VPGAIFGIGEKVQFQCGWPWCCCQWICSFPKLFEGCGR